MARSVVAAPLVLLALGCGERGDPAGTTTTPQLTTSVAVTIDDETTRGETTTGAPATDDTTTTGSEDDAPESDTTLIYDVGVDEDMGERPREGCEGKIDFLFVISRYSGMADFQEQLVSAFPQFIATIQEKFEEFDYHIMVVDGDPEWGSVPCNEDCQQDLCAGYPCELIDLVTPCDETLGAGNVLQAGANASNVPCTIDGSRRYLSKGQHDLAETFACVAQLGTNGGHWVGGALTAAMQPGINGPGGCNEGFLRDDALLVVTVISSTYDEPLGPLNSEGIPEDWAAAVLEAKGGDPESVVMFSIGDSTFLPGCNPGGWDGICEMVQMFPYWSITEVLADDYGPGFDIATDLVTEACDTFVPR